jgi:hypothetical protein
MAATSTETRVFNTLLTYTWDAYAEEASKNMLTSFPLVDMLYKNGRAKVVDGGARIDVTVTYGFNPGGQWYSGSDVLDMTDFEIATLAKFDWKNLHFPLTYTGEEVRKNSGAARQKDLVREKISVTENTAYKVLEIAMMGDGTANNQKVIHGLETFYPITPTTDPAVGALGGITAVGNPWWQNYAVTSFGSFAANGPGGTAADAWLDTWNTVSDGPDSPDLVLGAQDVWQFYHRASLDMAQIVFQQSSNNPDLSFPVLKYNGRTFTWSRSLPNGRVYFLRTGDMKFWVSSQANMTKSDFQKSWNQDKFAASVLTMCSFFINRRMFTAVIDGITA